MTHTELRDKIYELITHYFVGATVAWGEQNAVEPPDPFVKLKLENLQRGMQFIEKYDSTANRNVKYIQATTRLIVDVFTHGKVCTADGEYYYINTAIDDLRDLCDYMLSQYTYEWGIRNNIAIRPEGDILDISAVKDNDYEYRARVTFVISFFMTSEGHCGITRQNYSPTPSGGGTEALASEETSTIDRTKIYIDNNYD